MFAGLGMCLMQSGMVARSPEDIKAVVVKIDKMIKGSVYQGVMKSKSVVVPISVLNFCYNMHLPNKSNKNGCFVRKLLGKSFSLPWEIRATISTFKYTGLLKN